MGREGSALIETRSRVETVGHFALKWSQKAGWVLG